MRKDIKSLAGKKVRLNWWRGWFRGKLHLGQTYAELGNREHTVGNMKNQMTFREGEVTSVDVAERQINLELNHYGPSDDERGRDKYFARSGE